MLNTMRELTLLELNRRFSAHHQPLSALRETHAAELAPLLVEAGDKVARVYLLQADPARPGVVRLWGEDLTEEKARLLPFNRPSGSQSAAIGPVFKRSWSPNKTPAFGPSPKILNTTHSAFSQLGSSGAAWAGYFAEVDETLFGNASVHFSGRTHATGDNEEYPHPLAAAVALMPETKTAFLSVIDRDQRWPGQVPEYQQYLAQTLADIKYVTGTAAAQQEQYCPLCGTGPTTVYPNALKGAGINFANMDRDGAFPGIDSSRSWQGYSLCLDCADLLYIFKFHLLDQFQGRIAGSKALILPSLLGNPSGRGLFMKDWHDYISGLAGSKLKSIEQDLMEFFVGRDDAHLVLNILWADFVPIIDKCRGTIDDVLPSRLQQLITHNNAANNWQHPLAPRVPIDEAKFDLGMNYLFPLLKRPGGNAAKKANASPQLFAIKRQLADHLYHGTAITDPRPLWRELLDTARWYLREAADSDNPVWGLLHEGRGKKNIPFWTLAGWTRHLARFLNYLDLTGVLAMNPETNRFQPQMDALKPYFTPGSGIDRPEKAFAFLLGALFGKLLQVQGARGVNVSSNALTWLKRLNLRGRDLPELYNKIREKLLSYGTEASPEVRELLQELGRLGARLGDQIKLDNTSTCYFLLLGQSISTDLLPSHSSRQED